MSGSTRGFFLHVLEESLGILRDAGADHIVIGGLATRALLGMPLETEEDIDVMIRREDAEMLLEVFAGKGYATHRRDEAWIYKVARPDVTIDLIFRQAERIELDDEHITYSRTVKFEGIDLRAPGPEDLVVMKALFDGGETQGRWYGALEVLRRLPIDWDYLTQRGEGKAARRLLSLLLYASEEEIEIPDRVISRLMDLVRSGPREHALGS